MQCHPLQGVPVADASRDDGVLAEDFRVELMERFGVSRFDESGKSSPRQKFVDGLFAGRFMREAEKFVVRKEVESAERENIRDGACPVRTLGFCEPQEGFQRNGGDNLDPLADFSVAEFDPSGRQVDPVEQGDAFARLFQQPIELREIARVETSEPPGRRSRCTTLRDSRCSASGAATRCIRASAHAPDQQHTVG